MHNPALTIGLSMVLGMLAQVGSKHLHLPGIVLLLLSGILFGPDGLNWIDPTSIGPGPWSNRSWVNPIKTIRSK